MSSEIEKPVIASIAESLVLVKAVTKLATQADFVAMATAWEALKREDSELEKKYTPRKRTARAAWDMVLQDEKNERHDIQVGIAIAARLISEWHTEQKKLERADAPRLAVEQKKREEDQAIEQAVALEDAGIALGSPELLLESIDVLERAVEPRPAPMSMSSTPAVAGMRMKPVWESSVVDEDKLFKHLADHPEHRSIYKLNQTKLNGLAEFYKERLPTVLPGVSSAEGSKPEKKR